MPKDHPDYTDAQIEAVLPSLLQTHRCDPRQVDVAFSHLLVLAEMLDQCPNLTREPAVLFRLKDDEVRAVPIGNMLRVGRADDCEISFPGKREMSRYHFRIQRHDDGTYSATDTGSANGTFLLGSQTRITSHELRNGNVIEAGGVTFTFVRSEDDQTV